MTAAKQWDLIAVGDLFIDLILTGFSALPGLGEEGFCSACERETGGGPANTAAAFAKLGSRSAVFGIVGADEMEWCRRRFAERGVDTSMLLAHPEIASAITVAVSTPVDRIFYTYYGPNSCLPDLLQHIENRERLAQARHVHFAMPLAPELLAELGDWLRERGTTTSIDVGWQEKWLQDPCSREALAHIDWFLPNEREAERMTGESRPERMLDWFGRHCACSVALKLGRQGSAARLDGGIRFVPSIAVAPIDTTGAGDCFDAGFLYGILKGMPMEQSLRCGNICGALSTEAAGGIAGSPAIQRVRELLSK